MSNLFVPTDLPDDFFENKSDPEPVSIIEQKIKEVEEEVKDIKREQEARTAVKRTEKVNKRKA